MPAAQLSESLEQRITAALTNSYQYGDGTTEHPGPLDELTSNAGSVSFEREGLHMQAPDDTSDDEDRALLLGTERQRAAMQAVFFYDVHVEAPSDDPSDANGSVWLGPASHLFGDPAYEENGVGFEIVGQKLHRDDSTVDISDDIDWNSRMNFNVYIACDMIGGTTEFVVVDRRGQNMVVEDTNRPSTTGGYETILSLFDTNLEIDVVNYAWGPLLPKL